MPILIVLSLIASAAWSMPSDEPLEFERTPKMCDQFLVPSRAVALGRRIDATRDREGIVAEVSRRVVEAARWNGFRLVEFESEGYLIQVRARVTRHRVSVEVRKILSLREYRWDAEATRSLRSPLLDVWRGLSLGALELARDNPRVHLVTLKGLSMYNRKFVRLLRRRLGFHGTDLGHGALVFAWRKPDDRAGLWHRIEFGLRGPSEILRRFW